MNEKNTANRETLVIVSGLPRSGTSMMMKMLEAGGLPPFTDNIRVPDKDNPKGYYEFERVKQLEKDTSWLPEAKGKAVKVIAMLLKHLPLEYDYKVIFMRRNMHEILASQRQMLIRRGKSGDNLNDEEMSKNYHLHLKNIEAWLAARPNFEVMYVPYNDVLNSYSDYSKKIDLFLGGTLDTEKMSDVVDQNLYRQRR